MRNSRIAASVPTSAADPVVDRGDRGSPCRARGGAAIALHLLRRQPGGRCAACSACERRATRRRPRRRRWGRRCGGTASCPPIRRRPRRRRPSRNAASAAARRSSGASSRTRRPSGVAGLRQRRDEHRGHGAHGRHDVRDGEPSSAIRRDHADRRASTTTNSTRRDPAPAIAGGCASPGGRRAASADRDSWRCSLAVLDRGRPTASRNTSLSVGRREAERGQRPRRGERRRAASRLVAGGVDPQPHPPVRAFDDIAGRPTRAAGGRRANVAVGVAIARRRGAQISSTSPDSTTGRGR